MENSSYQGGYGGDDNRHNRYSGARRPSSFPEGFALYYIAALCPVEINEKVESYKSYMQVEYGCRAAQKSPAHLTLVPPFQAEEDMEPLFQNFISAYNKDATALDVQLVDFGHFNRRVLFVDVAPNEALTSLEDQVNFEFSDQFPSIIFRSRPEFHPHVTIATRDIPENRFDQIWQYFQVQNMEATFQVSAISLFKLVKGLWQVIA